MDSPALKLPVLGDAHTITIGGRVFTPATVGQTTFDQDLYIMANIEEAGMEEIFVDVAANDQITDFAKKLIVKAYRSGKLWAVLAGVMIEENIPWSHEYAASTAKFFANLTSQQDKDSLHEAMAGVIIGFFASAVKSFSSSRKSTEQENDPVAAFYEEMRQRASGDSVTSESGTPSSDASLTMIPRSSTTF